MNSDSNLKCSIDDINIDTQIKLFQSLNLDINEALQSQFEVIQPDEINLKSSALSDCIIKEREKKDNLLKNVTSSVSYKIKSVSPNNILNNFISDWLHIDAEGYDAKILLMVKDEHLKNLKFIIWEHIHLDDEIRLKLKEKLELFGFKVTIGLEYNSFAVKI